MNKHLGLNLRRYKDQSMQSDINIFFKLKSHLELWDRGNHNRPKQFISDEEYFNRKNFICLLHLLNSTMENQFINILYYGKSVLGATNTA